MRRKKSITILREKKRILKIDKETIEKNEYDKKVKEKKKDVKKKMREKKKSRENFKKK